MRVSVVPRSKVVGFARDLLNPVKRWTDLSEGSGTREEMVGRG